MHDDKEAKIYALAATVLIAALIRILLVVGHLSLDPKPQEVPPKGEILLAEEEFVEFTDMPVAPELSDNTDATANLPQPSEQEAQPAPETGHDLADAGQAAKPAPTLSSDKPSDMKVKKPDTKKETKSGPEVDKKKQEEERTKREANNQVANAFKNAKGKHNTANGTADNGNAGRPDGKAAQGGLTGHGTGSVGGGWSIPAYAPVPSPVTGSVKLVVKIDRTGRVTSVTFDGGVAPAATNSAVKAACIKEVKSRHFTRSNPDDAPEQSTAYITYTFK